jgi:hypothetical protein
VALANARASCPELPPFDKARWVERGTALLPGCPPPPWWLWRPPVGFPPPAVGMLSMYWLIAELPGGVLPFPFEFADATAGIRAEMKRMKAVAPTAGRMLIVLIG